MDRLLAATTGLYWITIWQLDGEIHFRNNFPPSRSLYSETKGLLSTQCDQLCDQLLTLYKNLLMSLLNGMLLFALVH